VDEMTKKPVPKRLKRNKYKPLLKEEKRRLLLQVARSMRRTKGQSCFEQESRFWEGYLCALSNFGLMDKKVHDAFVKKWGIVLY